MSAQNKNATCRCTEPCPIKHAMSMIGGKWKISILCALWFDGQMRYNELNCRIKGISNTMLASSLKELESDGLAKREQYPEVPIRVEYSVTEECAKLVPAFEIMRVWGMEKLKKQDEA